MKIYKIYPQGFASNCFLVTGDGKNAIAIDPAQPRVLDEAERHGLKIKYALLTHGHFDHIGGCAAVSEAGAKIGCLAAERELALGIANMGRAFGVRVPPFPVDFTFEDGDELDLCGVKLRVLATPGHTAGSCCLMTENALFTGDTLFAGDVGRTDLPTGDSATLKESLQKLAALEGDFTVYAGHGADSTLERERADNPHLK